jgi:hypothetical protein
MNLAECFWWVLTIAAMVWYSTVTVYVAFRGAYDIQHMLKKLEDQHRDGDSRSS